jgi:hypothetical protein
MNESKKAALIERMKKKMADPVYRAAMSARMKEMREARAAQGMTLEDLLSRSVRLAQYMATRFEPADMDNATPEFVAVLKKMRGG